MPVTIPEPTYDKTKPLVKEFVDKNQSVSRFLQICIPHVSHSSYSKANKVFESKDGREIRYRVNYYRDDEAEFIVVKRIIDSRYVRITLDKDGKPIKFDDLTIVKK